MKPPAQTNVPSMLITVDTEGDNLWSRPSRIETKNAGHLYRFQALCESKGFKPTYLTNYEMAKSEIFVELGREVVKRKTGEIGMHLHAWNSPPSLPLTDNDFDCRPYLIEYPDTVIAAKVSHMTSLLEDTFAVSIKSHRAGRWAFNETYARTLVECGYCVDCSVTPHVTWEQTKGHPEKNGGSNYLLFPETAYFLDLSDISRPGSSRLMELPVTIMPFVSTLNRLTTGFYGFELFRRLHAKNVFWLRPNGRNLDMLLWVVDKATTLDRDYIQFMIHSSELMPAGSPTFKTQNDIDQLYRDLDTLFSHIAAKGYIGRTLYDHYEAHSVALEH